jgi:hypothetical protein
MKTCKACKIYRAQYQGHDGEMVRKKIVKKRLPDGYPGGT